MLLSTDKCFGDRETISFLHTIDDGKVKHCRLLLLYHEDIILRVELHLLLGERTKTLRRLLLDRLAMKARFSLTLQNRCFLLNHTSKLILDNDRRLFSFLFIFNFLFLILLIFFYGFQFNHCLHLLEIRIRILSHQLLIVLFLFLL